MLHPKCRKEEFAMTLRKQTSTSETQLRHDTPEEDEIRLRAYELYEQRGRENGHDMEDWLQAEVELSSQRRKAIAA
jgi:hypothetical protein